jgi:SAM-dependent methyltransferase
MQDLAQNHTDFTPIGAPRRKALSEVITDFAPDWNSDWCWINYKPVVKALSQELCLRRLCEIGGGRNPLFSVEEMQEIGSSLTVNDISQGELDRGPGGYDTLCLDIAGDIRRAAPGQFDLMFSKMVFEHVRDVRKAWRNVHTLLTPGGVALAFFPTLYALPFLINRLFPESVSGPLVRAVFPERSDDGKYPKFPAFYDCCVGDGGKLKPILKDIGFSECHVLPFWGHHYFDRLPLVRGIDHAFNRFAAKRNWSNFTTYAFVVVRK